MAVTPKNKILVWITHGAYCSYEGCPKHLVMSSIEGSESLVGEVAHIVSAAGDGPRSEYDLSAEGITHDEPENLMLMCKDHHKLIDDNPDDYSVELLRKWRTANLIKAENLKTTEVRKVEKDKLTIALYISNLEEIVDLKNWKNWGYSLLSAHQPRIGKEIFDSLEIVPSWIISRIWPKRDEFKDVEMAFQNFKNVLNDFLIEFKKHSKETGVVYTTNKFYQIMEWNPERYERLSCQYDFHTWLIEDLFYEMTRAINLICDSIRDCLDSSYRIDEGVVLVQTGMDINFMEHTYRVEYQNTERYEGLEEFKISRGTRDRSASVGANYRDPDFINMRNSCS